MEAPAEPGFLRPDVYGTPLPKGWVGRGVCAQAFHFVAEVFVYVNYRCDPLPMRAVEFPTLVVQ